MTEHEGKSPSGLAIFIIFSSSNSHRQFNGWCLWRSTHASRSSIQYDAEWIHDQCRLEWGVESVIKPAVHRADGQRNGIWRSGMSERYLKRKSYGRRWAVETFFSGLKRTTGSMLTARRLTNSSPKPPAECWPIRSAVRRTNPSGMFSTEQNGF